MALSLWQLRCWHLSTRLLTLGWLSATRLTGGHGGLLWAVDGSCVHRLFCWFLVTWDVGYRQVKSKLWQVSLPTSSIQFHTLLWGTYRWWFNAILPTRAEDGLVQSHSTPRRLGSAVNVVRLNETQLGTVGSSPSGRNPAVHLPRLKHVLHSNSTRCSLTSLGMLRYA